MRILYTFIIDKSCTEPEELEKNLKALMKMYEFDCVCMNEIKSPIPIPESDVKTQPFLFHRLTGSFTGSFTDTTEDPAVSYKLTGFKCLEEFIDGLFYKDTIDLHFDPLKKYNDNPKQVVNFNLNPLFIIQKHDVLRELLSTKFFSRTVTQITNYGVFIRFSTNKIVRLYWNTLWNGGLPLSPKKEKHRAAENIFFLHDVHHFLLPDMMYTGNASTNNKLGKQVYCYWRLLGEAMTITFSEMLAPKYLTSTKQYINELAKVGADIDHPLRLFNQFKMSFDLNEINDVFLQQLKKLLWASYLYFGDADRSGYDTLINDVSNEPDNVVMIEFHRRYEQVAKRGIIWTENNFDHIVEMGDVYRTWYQQIKESVHHKTFGAEILEDMINMLFQETDRVNPNLTNHEVMRRIFDYVFEDILVPILTRDVLSIDPQLTRGFGFRRYMYGNLMLLTKHNVPIEPFLKVLRNEIIDPRDIDTLMIMYKKSVDYLYHEKKLDHNEMRIYQDFFLMIPPNILKKDRIRIFILNELQEQQTKIKSYAKSASFIKPFLDQDDDSVIVPSESEDSMIVEWIKQTLKKKFVKNFVVVDHGLNLEYIRSEFPPDVIITKFLLVQSTGCDSSGLEQSLPSVEQSSICRLPSVEQSSICRLPMVDDYKKKYDRVIPISLVPEIDDKVVFTIKREFA